MWLGLDLGTFSAKAMVLDREGGTVAEAHAPYSVAHPAPGQAEIDPEHWWAAIERCLQQIPAGVRREVGAIGLSGQMHGVVLCDAAFRPLRPAMLWMDRRATPQLAGFPHDAAARTGNPLSPGMAGPMLCWLQAHEHRLLQSARWALQPKDWLRGRLGGEAVTDPSDASATLLAGADGCWDGALLDQLGLPATLLPPCQPAAAPAGGLSVEAAAALGLRVGIPLAVGAADTAAAAFGSGLHHAGAIQLSTGSGAQLIVMDAQPSAYDPRLNRFCAVQGGSLPGWYRMAAMQNCGVALEWARGLLGLSWPEAYRRALAADLPASAALFVPHLTGERSPWMHAGLGGSWRQLRDSDDAATLMRAAFLGVALSIRAGLEALDGPAPAGRALHLAGGGSIHPAWRQLLADVLCRTLHPSDRPNASARGAALLGAAAAGHAWEAVLALAPPGRSGTPVGPSGDDRYAASYAQYLGAIAADLAALPRGV